MVRKEDWSQGAAKGNVGKKFIYMMGRKDLAAAQFADVNGAPGGQVSTDINFWQTINDLWSFGSKFNTESVLEIVYTSKGSTDWGWWGQGK